MTSRVWVGVAFALGALSGLGGGLAVSRDKPRPPAPKTVTSPSLCEEDDDAMAANASLTTSLQECNRQLTRLGQQRVAVPAASSAAAPSGSQGRRWAARPPPSAEDWARYAEAGVVPYRIPCLRSTPFAPSVQQLDRLGLAPQDADAVKEAYAKSNERMVAQIRPLCSAVLGGPQIADRVGPSACVKAITDAARRESPDKMREALVRVAEVNGGKRPAPAPDDKLAPVETLLLSMTTEGRTFEADLAARIGPDDARAITESRGMCAENGFASAAEGGPGPLGNARPARRGAQ
jgi:hypothetical protein